MVDGTQLEQELVTTLSNVFLNSSNGGDDEIEGLDSDLISYIAGMLSSTVLEGNLTTESISTIIEDVLVPFLESVQCPDHMTIKAIKSVETIINQLCMNSSNKMSSSLNTAENNNENQKLQQGIVKMSLNSNSTDTKDLWGLDGTKLVKAMANDLIDPHSDKTSMRDKRKQRKAQAEQDRKALSSKYDSNIDEGGNGLVSMNVRSLMQQQQLSNNQGADKARDIQVRNVTVSLNNGTTLLESGELKFSYQRRYGLIGENGVGK
jgi:hypothetical protein